MTTIVGGGADPAFLDDVLLKEGPLGPIEGYLEAEYPHEFGIDRWARGQNILCVRSAPWLAYYKPGWPLALYHEGDLACGFRVGDHPIRIDQEGPDAIWARVGARVVMERGDFPRLEVSGEIKLSRTPKRTDLENVFTLENGYAISVSRRCQPIEYGLVCPENTWIMVGREEDSPAIHRRVLCVKIYDGPHPYQARGTDIRLADPVPLASEAEYVIYAYDERGIKGLYREVYEGVAPQKKAMIISGEDLLRRARSTEGSLRMENGQLVGKGRVSYSLPLKATKILDIWHRGGEVKIRINPDGTGWTIPEGYDGLATYDLEVEAEIYDALSAIRVEWESLKEWEPVGRPRIDIIRPDEHPEHEQRNRNKVRITGRTGEGLGQNIDLYTGIYSASADVRCLEGRAIVDVGGMEVVSWNPLDKTVRGSGDFAANAGRYETLLTGEEDPQTGLFSYEIDRFQVADGGQKDYLPEDLRWYIETEKGEMDISESVNNPSIPVSLPETRRWRIGVRVPQNIGWMRDELAVNYAKIEQYHTGRPHLVQNIRWRGEGRSRIHYPTNVMHPPVPTPYIIAEGNGSASWEVDTSEDPGNVRLRIEDADISFRKGEFYRDFTLENGTWRIEIREEEAIIYLRGDRVGRIEGRFLPASIVHYGSEDIEMDCSGGSVQLRRGMGPRLEGFEVGGASVAYTQRDGVLAFGEDQEEAEENLPHYRVISGR